ncbi:hypothetical protein EV421DRAFT_1906812 [Armillaria borealis]|uniref:Helicase C-terminal domain-containing protein n=1 Tax=Armillaria borealis TaxID=47425 RepID=A0AA39J8T9_9AGAR|nr:hypothetical protein EV421DRAFT_1906812 [Armillaria borealis]
MYARHCVNNLDDVRNYDCFIRNPFPSNGKLTDQPRVLIFCDNNNQTRHISRYLNSVAPPQFRDRGFVRHYHGQMSKKYLKQAHEQFTIPTGHCRVLVATLGESVGIDFADVEYACNAGLMLDGCDSNQRAGRIVRRPEMTGLFVTFYEEWARTIKEEEFDEAGADLRDPDRPRGKLRAGASKRDRAPLSGIKFVNAPCVREFFADYLGDNSSNERMLRWREEEHFADPLGAVRPDYLIVTEKNIVKLCQVHPSNMKLPSDIVSLLGEEDDWASEWSEKIFGVIKQFDTEYPVKTRKAYKK